MTLKHHQHFNYIMILFMNKIVDNTMLLIYHDVNPRVSDIPILTSP